MLQSCMFYRKMIVLVCFVCFYMNFTSLVIKLLLIVFNMKSHPRSRQMMGLNFLKIWHWIKSQYKLSYKVLKEEYRYDTLLDIFPYLTLIQLKDYIDWVYHCFTVVSMCILLLHFLSQKRICITVSLMVIKQKEWIFTNEC